ncbi:hypothetical protein Tco_1214545 [Tanacetum coccineum]
MAGLPPRAQRHLWLRYEVEGYTEEIVQDYEQRLAKIFSRHVNWVHILDFEGLIEEMRHGLTDRLRMIYTRAEGQVLFTRHAWRRLFEIRGPLVHEWSQAQHDLETVYLVFGIAYCRGDGFEAYWLGSTRAIPDKGDLKAYWIEISLDGDFLGVAPSYTLIRDPLRRLCHRRLAEYFGLVSDEGLIGLTVIARELSMIDMNELVRLRICDRLDDTRAWVAPSPERQQVAAAEAPEGVKGAPFVNEGVQAVLAPVQAPQEPPLAASRTMP